MIQLCFFGSIAALYPATTPRKPAPVPWTVVALFPANLTSAPKIIPKMEKLLYMDYSMKNVRIASEKAYTKKLIEQTSKFIPRIRWKAFFHENPDAALPI